MRFFARTFSSKAEEIAHREQHARYVIASARRQRDAGFHPDQVALLVRSARVEWRKAQRLAREG